MALNNNVARINGTKFTVNTRYGKLVDGELVYSTNPISYEGRTIVCAKTATAVYLKYGYKQIMQGDFPEVGETQEVREYYTEDDARIYINYEVVDNE